MSLAREEFTEESIERSKYVLKAAIIESMRHCNPDDVRAFQMTVFDLLEDSAKSLEHIRYMLLDGRFLDAAQDLGRMGRNDENNAPKLFIASARLYAPLMTFQAIQAFEAAMELEADLKEHHVQISRLYERLGDMKRAILHKEYANKFRRPEPKLGENIAVLPLTLGRDSSKTFSSMLDLSLEGDDS